MNSSKLFLCKENSLKNLETLSNFTHSDTSNTKTITEEVYKKVSKMSVSPSTLREICLTSSLFAIFSGPFLFTAKKTVECVLEKYNKDLFNMPTCLGEITNPFSKKIDTITYVCFSSFIALAATGLYAGARYFFQDSKQLERYNLLNKEYVAIAKQLEKKPHIDMAKNLIKNKDLIQMNLIQEGKLSESQAKSLIIPIVQVAHTIIDKENLLIEMKKNQALAPTTVPLTITDQKPSSWFRIFKKGA
jgi:hypothetical protein